MLVNLKTLQQIDLEAKVKEFIATKKNGAIYTEEIKEFMRKCQQNRDVMAHFQSTKMNVSLNNIKLVTGHYINQIDFLKNIIVFNNTIDDNGIKFNWLDTLRKVNVSSLNLEFEYYNVLFNLGTIYFIMSKDTSQEAENNEDVSKNVVKGFRYAAGIFQKIKNEAPLSLGKELPLDLSSDYMSYCSKLSIIYGQLELINYLEKKKSNYGMFAKLAKGLCNLYEDLINLTAADLNIHLDSTQKLFLANRKIYCEAKLYFCLKEEALCKFNETGIEYGTAVAYQELAVTKMAEYGQNICQFHRFIKVDDFESLYAREKALLEDMQNKNFKIYHFVIPKLEGIAYEGIIKIEPLLHPDLLSQIDDSKCLQDLIPKEVSDMITKYKANIMDSINKNINQNENERKIDEFLKMHNLFNSFAIQQSNKITDELWKSIFEVQEKGGYSKLISTIESIRLKNIELEKTINDSILILQKEAQDDATQSNYFKENWLREPSPKLNCYLVQQLNKYLNDLLKTREYDNRAQKDILQCSVIFEKLSNTRTIIEEKIPMRNDVFQISKSKEAQELKKVIDQLLGIKLKIAEIIKTIFDYLNGPLTLKQFLNIYYNKQNETHAIQHNQKEFELKFEEFRVQSKEVGQLKEEILKKKEAFQKVQVTDNISVVNENEKYKNELLSCTTLYNKKYLALSKGLNHYSDLESKINLLVSQSLHFVNKRNEEKIHLINYITKGISFPSEQQLNQLKPTEMGKYASAESYLDPQINLFTNLKVKNYNIKNEPHYK